MHELKNSIFSLLFLFIQLTSFLYFFSVKICFIFKTIPLDFTIFFFNYRIQFMHWNKKPSFDFTLNNVIIYNENIYGHNNKSMTH